MENSGLIETVTLCPESIAQGVVIGVAAALVTTAILGLTGWTRHCLAKRKDVKYIRGLLIEGRKCMMDVRDGFHEGMGVPISSGSLRAALYNKMVRRVDVALERWTVNLSHSQKKDVYDALDWFGTEEEGLLAIKRNGKVMFPELPEGKWPTEEMPEEAADRKFMKLQSVKWLKLRF